MPLRTVLRLLAIVFLTTPFTCAQTIQPATEKRIDEIIAQAMAEQNIPAISVAIALDGGIRYQKAFGKADIENNVAATPETLFRTASIAKPMTAVAAMRLLEDGKLDLDAPVQKYCSAFPQRSWTVTTRELLGHVSGVRHYKDDEIEYTHHYAKLSDGFNIFANDPLLFEPGTKFQYSTYGFSVVGCALEGAAGKTYPEVMQQLVFTPAHMIHTSVDDVFAVVPHRARGYSKRDAEVINAGLMDSSYKIPGGGYVSSPGDLVTFADALLAGTLIKPDTRKLMWTSQKLRDGQETDYGLGWGVKKFEGEDIVAHTGGQQGASCSLTIYPGRKMVIAVMTNLDGAAAIEIDHKIALVLLQELFGVTLSTKPAAPGIVTVGEAPSQ